MRLKMEFTWWFNSTEFHQTVCSSSGMGGMPLKGIKVGDFLQAINGSLMQTQSYINAICLVAKINWMLHYITDCFINIDVFNVNLSKAWFASSRWISCNLMPWRSIETDWFLTNFPSSSNLLCVIFFLSGLATVSEYLHFIDLLTWLKEKEEQVYGRRAHANLGLVVSCWGFNESLWLNFAHIRYNGAFLKDACFEVKNLLVSFLRG